MGRYGSGQDGRELSPRGNLRSSLELSLLMRSYFRGSSKRRGEHHHPVYPPGRCSSRPLCWESFARSRSSGAGQLPSRKCAMRSNCSKDRRSLAPSEKKPRGFQGIQRGWRHQAVQSYADEQIQLRRRKYARRGVRGVISARDPIWDIAPTNGAQRGNVSCIVEQAESPNGPCLEGFGFIGFRC